MDRGVQRHDSQHDGIRQRSHPFLVIIDPSRQILYEACPKGFDPAEIIEPGSTRLRPEFDDAVRDAIASHDRESDLAEVRIVAGASIVHIANLRGSGKMLFAVSIESYRHRDSLRRAAERFALTQRECDVLALSFDGLSSAQIAKRLCIAEGTASVYLKHLFRKTNTRSRAALVAKILGWDTR